MKPLYTDGSLDFFAPTPDDFAEAREILGDRETMYAWEHGFSDEEVTEFLRNHAARCARDGCGYCAVRRRADGLLVGFAGLLWEQIDGRPQPGVGYIIRRSLWRQGVGLACARVVLTEWFVRRGVPAVYAEIRPGNTASRALAEKLGMQVTGELIKHYRGQDMPHLIYAVGRDAFRARFSR